MVWGSSELVTKQIKLLSLGSSQAWFHLIIVIYIIMIIIDYIDVISASFADCAATALCWLC